MALTDRQRRFVAAYVELGVASRAAIKAGYSPDSAETNGPRLLRNAQIAAAVDERQANLANELGLTRQYVLDGLRRTYEQSIEGAPKVHQGEVVRGEDGELIREWSPSGANRALELIGKAHGMFTDRAVMDIGATVVYQLDMGGSDLTETAEDSE
jgi:phage terminase small subunit